MLVVNIAYEYVANDEMEAKKYSEILAEKYNPLLEKMRELRIHPNLFWAARIEKDEQMRYGEIQDDLSRALIELNQHIKRLSKVSKMLFRFFLEIHVGGSRLHQDSTFLNQLIIQQLKLQIILAFIKSLSLQKSQKYKEALEQIESIVEMLEKNVIVKEF